MTVAEYIVDFLVSKGTSDAFGIPGGVLLDLIYAFEAKDGIKPHLSYHEQSAGFAASGYAQISGRLGVAYATRGPGFTNLVTSITDAYCDSIPVLFITAHSSAHIYKNMRVMFDQELDTCSMVKDVTKFSYRLDKLEDVVPILNKAYLEAMSGRKGPVLLDIKSCLFKMELGHVLSNYVDNVSCSSQTLDVVMQVADEIKNAKRPVILIGDGINQAEIKTNFESFIEKIKLPVISSRISQNVIGASDYYFGYVGSHGIRCAHFILSKADLVISLGNRLNFPLKSESYKGIVNDVKFIRFEIDESELERSLPHSEVYNEDIRQIINDLNECEADFGNHTKWLDVCSSIRTELSDVDLSQPVLSIREIIKSAVKDTSIVGDVGENEFWLSQACVLGKFNNRTIFSKSLATLGSGLGKAIGAYFATKKPVLCFIGDQGLQMNIQELMFIGQHELPISVIIINNNTSGMIKYKEKLDYNGKFIHTTNDSGYSTPNFEKIAESYNFNYYKFIDNYDVELFKTPCLIDINIDPDIAAEPVLPKGASFQNLYPELSKTKYEYLNNL